ncbi:hypothetical protein [Phenylobacterium aquaticum]|uniref:hypothetical protein n=1 Tax=Phenylobacterium aquaticum TaxID=1763816 RepID=UPI0026EFBED4|nr:hypothetical protein [Phenylobacterium aquaticum]
MKIITLALAGALAVGSLAVSVPASAQPYGGGPSYGHDDHRDRHEDRYERRHHRQVHPVRVCRTEWRHHHQVRICHTEMRRW